ncbi:MAG: hypothetical protein AAGA62_13820, partial [Bacteroidota bacterium]
MVRYFSFFGALWLLVLIAACSEPTKKNEPLQTAFYHWETSLSPSQTARTLLDSFACEQLYLKVFDLSWENDRLATSAWLEAEDTNNLPVLTPVVFITNEVFHQLPAERTLGLAEDILSLVDDLMPGTYQSLQLDCDWTATTQSNYFALLRAVQSLRPQLAVSCTVRLHQYRDREAQG